MIPKNATLAYKGDIFKVYTWEQKLFDGSYKTFETVTRKPTVQLIVVEDDKIVLLDEEAATGERYISLPGGMVEWDENPEKAAERELLEETGMKASMEHYMREEHQGKIIWPTDYYICSDAKKIAEPTPEAGEKIKILKFDFDDFIEETQKKSFRNRFFSNHIRLLKAEGRLEEFKRRVMTTRNI
ncbi:MAG: NUDIX hydrolase [Candidatus Woesearchaeota archaeon]